MRRFVAALILILALAAVPAMTGSLRTASSSGGGAGATVADTAADTEILVGTGAGTAAWVLMSGDATIANTGAVTVADDSHAHTTTTLSGIDVSDDTNLTASNGITLTGDALAPTTIATAGRGFFGMWGYGVPSGTAANFTASANRQYVWATQILVPQTIDRVHFRHAAAGGAGCQQNVCLYNSAGAIVAEGTAADCTGGAADVTVTFSEVTLTPGVYFFSPTTDDATAGVFQGIQNALIANAGSTLNVSASYVGYGVNASADGNCADTLGGITEDNSATTVPYAYFTNE